MGFHCQIRSTSWTKGWEEAQLRTGNYRSGNMKVKGGCQHKDRYFFILIQESKGIKQLMIKLAVSDQPI